MTARPAATAVGAKEALKLTADLSRDAGAMGFEILVAPLGEDYHHVFVTGEGAPPADLPCQWQIRVTYPNGVAYEGQSPRSVAGNHPRSIMLACTDVLEKMGASVQYTAVPSDASGL